MYLKIFFVATAMLFAALGVDAQNVLSGRVVTSDGQPLAGASVVWSGTYDGTSTDKDGKFKIHTISGKHLIVASFLGYETDTIDVRKFQNGNELKIILKDNAQALTEVVVAHRRKGTTEMNGALNGLKINQAELFKAACCNLGESFTTNPSVDVNYSDAATGAKQIKLLGLSGLYVQMLSENIPDFRLSSSPYALGYVPGAWLKGIQVSKGASSVKNGYESITGQIDVEYLKPDDQQGAGLNVYGNSDGRLEVNADANKLLTDNLSTEILAHYENSFKDMDDNGDNFFDKPNVRQVNLHNRWHYMKDHYIFHGGVTFLDEKRDGGQIEKVKDNELFKISSDTRRVGAYLKNAWILNHEKNMNIAVINNLIFHDFDAVFGKKSYESDEKTIYSQVIFETEIVHHHSVSTGFSVNYDNDNQYFTLTTPSKLQNLKEKETVSGVYGQYTYDHDGKVVLMAGVRADKSSVYGTFFTPRFHIKIKPSDYFSVRLSSGKGYRMPHVLAENHYLLSSGRQLVIGDLEQESAWNSGVSFGFKIPTGDKTLKINTEYYYTNFLSGTLIDYDLSPRQIVIKSSKERSYSQTFQADVAYDFFKNFEFSAAYRMNDVKAYYNNELHTKPLTNKYKALFTLSYKTPLEIWQFDANLQINGGGRLPDYFDEREQLVSGGEFAAFEQLNVQITKWFKKFSIYLGGENLTNYKQKNPIISAANPWSESFEPTLVYAPINGAMFYIGLRINFLRK